MQYRILRDCSRDIGVKLKVYLRLSAKNQFGMDKETLENVLQELIADEKMTIVISSNIEDDLDKIADYIVEVKDGGCRMKEAYEYYKK